MALISLNNLVDNISDIIVQHMESTSNLLYAERLMDIFGDDPDSEQIKEVLFHILQTIDAQFCYKGIEVDIAEARECGFFKSLEPLKALLADISNRIGVKILIDIVYIEGERVKFAFLPNAYLPPQVEFLNIMEITIFPEEAGQPFAVVPDDTEMAEMIPNGSTPHYHPEYGILKGSELQERSSDNSPMAIDVSMDDIMDFFETIDCSKFSNTATSLESITIADCDKMAFGEMTKMVDQ